MYYHLDLLGSLEIEMDFLKLEQRHTNLQTPDLATIYNILLISQNLKKSVYPNLFEAKDSNFFDKNIEVEHSNTMYRPGQPNWEF